MPVAEQELVDERLRELGWRAETAVLGVEAGGKRAEGLAEDGADSVRAAGCVSFWLWRKATTRSPATSMSSRRSR